VGVALFLCIKGRYFEHNDQKGGSAMNKKDRKILMAIILLLSGYWLGSISQPKGMELLIFGSLALISGLCSGIFIMKMIYKCRSHSSSPFTFLGYEIRKAGAGDPAPAPAEKNVLPMTKSKPKKKASAPADPPSQQCDMCQGETVTLAGQQIQCPKCKGKKKQSG
jgi:hypothetical protein